MGCCSGAIPVKYAPGFAGRFGLSGGVVGWRWPGAGDVYISDFLYDLRDAWVEFSSEGVSEVNL